MIGGDSAELTPAVPINLTALLDVMVNLLFFLMLGSAAQATEVEAAADLTLPISTAQDAAQGSPRLEITAHDLQVDRTSLLPRSALAGDGRIVPLYRQLMQWRSSHDAAADAVLLLCDQDVDYGLLSRVMETAAAAGFVRFRMGTQAAE